MKRLAVIVDYQNVMLTGHKVFAPEVPLHKRVIDPYRLGCQIAKARNVPLPPDDKCAVARVEVYRGCPSQKRDPQGYSRNQAQMSQWMAGHHGQVEVSYRTLKYRKEGPPQEKGVDVLCALALVRAARSGLYDVVVLASRDTDLAPALDEAYRMKAPGVKIETVKWYDPDVPWTNGRLRAEHPIWCTNLWLSEYEASLDPTIYS